MKHNFLLNPPLFVFLTLAAIILLYFFVPEYNMIPFPQNLGGLLVSAIGIYIMNKTYKQFRKHETGLSIQESKAMITTGIFSKTRNPMYLGMISFLEGIALCSTNLFSLLVPFVFWLYLAVFVVPREEKLMEKVFGDKYLDYKNLVPRWI